MAELKVPCVSKSLSTFITILFSNLPNVCCNPLPGVKMSAPQDHLCVFFYGNFGPCIPHAY